MRGRCDGCGLIKSVTEIKIVRKYSPDLSKMQTGAGRVGRCCKSCWEGQGDSSPVIYWP